MTDADIIVIGGGIAGSSVAAEISAFAQVILLERETHWGYHSTGRSAASFSENYGPALVRKLAIASREFLDAPPANFAEHPLLMPLPTLTIARHDQQALLREQFAVARELLPSLAPLTVEEAVERVPILRPDYVASAYLEPNSMEIDVHGLHQGYMRRARLRGARLVLGAEVTAIARRERRWQVTTNLQTYTASTIVNAAGAWSDSIAQLADVPPIGLTPRRRTAFTVALPEGMNPRRWPMVDDVGEEFYFKPDAGHLLVSPADATASPPCDSLPDEVDVAMAVERLERATTLDVRRVVRSWAGLRTFAPDGSPVVGCEPTQPAFHWMAAQGGYGIQTSPALSRVCAALLRGGELPAEFEQYGILAADLSVERFRRGGRC